ncbi:flagellar hook assembly protein FlgD [Anaerobacillus sp. MEB173]|uniref:flagellar hook assembly protein FlgD n=1 Tax=Anaerobacillus sp. MEB173 TaxID=3383345 RepID=UPI003F9224E2
MPNTITESLYLVDRQAQQRNTGQSLLDKDAFLRILLTQLQNQDPMNPMEDKEFIAQMATFTSLEQMTNMSKSMEKFVSIHQNSQLLQHSELIGKSVKWSKEVQVDEYRTRTDYYEHVVKSVRMDQGNVRLELEDGTLIRADQLVQISSAPIPDNQKTENLDKEQDNNNSGKNESF